MTMIKGCGWHFPLLVVASSLVACLADDDNDERLAAAFQRFDQNEDGLLSREEAGASPFFARRFDLADRDDDAQLSFDEVRAVVLGRDREEQPLPAPPEGVRQVEHALTVDEREREFVVQLPAEPKGPLPVVFGFHGGGGSGRGMVGLFRDLVADEQFLAVYPSGWQRNWNDGRGSTTIAAQTEGVDDEKFVRAMVDFLAQTYPVDRTRLFATGISNGGIFSHFLATRAADLFAGIAPVVGGLAEPLADGWQPSQPISLLVLQGEEDQLVPIGGGGIAGRDSRGRVIATEQMLQLYLAHDGITGEPVVIEHPDNDPNDGTTTTIRRWPPGNNGVKVEYWLIHGGGHTMPGAGRRGPAAEAAVGRSSGDFSGVEAIWSFFKSCPPRHAPDPEVGPA
jgi:polyhydroxybutyrate depolymerase